jgi:hypothetical protein
MDRFLRESIRRRRLGEMRSNRNQNPRNELWALFSMSSLLLVRSTANCAWIFRFYAAHARAGVLSGFEIAIGSPCERGDR